MVLEVAISLRSFTLRVPTDLAPSEEDPLPIQVLPASQDDLLESGIWGVSSGLHLQHYMLLKWPQRNDKGKTTPRYTTEIDHCCDEVGPWSWELLCHESFQSKGCPDQHGPR